MSTLKNDLSNLQELFPDSFTSEQQAMCKTIFYKRLSLLAHTHYKGKIQTNLKVPVDGINWFNVWYTPGVSSVSTSIRDDNEMSFQLSNRNNLVAVVSDSTRVLGDGDCTPPGGLGVMEGKAMLMKYLGGVDATALCIDSRDEKGEASADKIIDFVKMLQPGFGAINLEDISQPNCYKVLDVLRKECDIPVWHDDAQGTACVTLAGIINALKLANKKIEDCKIILYGAGAANTSIARLLIKDGADSNRMILFDINGSLHDKRIDYQEDTRYYPQWELCKITNPNYVLSEENAFKDADILIALSKPGPNTIKAEWISSMADKSIVFVCANPIPEIYPYKAKEAGAYIVATGRGDFPNQVNNSICFPSILKGTLLVAARKITDSMAICAAHAIAAFAEKRGISTENIMPTMLESELFPVVAADVAMQAVKEGIARNPKTRDEVYQQAKQDIEETHATIHALQEKNLVKPINQAIVNEALEWAIQKIASKK